MYDIEGYGEVSHLADELIRAHLPDGWQIEDKTGARGYGSRAKIAFLQSPEPRTYLAAIYLTESQAPFAERNRVLPEIDRVMTSEIVGRKD